MEQRQDMGSRVKPAKHARVNPGLHGAPIDTCRSRSITIPAKTITIPWKTALFAACKGPHH
jgi:hypothetical protein